MPTGGSVGTVEIHNAANDNNDLNCNRYKSGAPGSAPGTPLQPLQPLAAETPKQHKPLLEPFAISEKLFTP